VLLVSDFDGFRRGGSVWMSANLGAEVGRAAHIGW
jgi:hypothetical protein